MANIKFVPNNYPAQCHICDGRGCEKCDNTGIYYTKSYFAIYTDKKGLKQAFIVDTIK